MLSLFKENTPSLPLAKAEAAIKVRHVISSFLNKGIIPTWEEFLIDFPSLDEIEDPQAIKENFQKLVTWKFLESLIEAEATEFYFHNPDNCQNLTFDGKKNNFKISLLQEEWQLWLEIISVRFKQNWNVQNPFCSFYGELFGRTFRFSLIHGSTSPLGCSKLILRAIKKGTIPVSSFGHSELLISGVKQKKSILIAGATGSGKTALLTSLIQCIAPDEHLVILEDTFEILSDHSYQTRFLSGDSTQTSLKSYLSYSLRLSPDRIILGEMRSHEVVPFLMAMNTGHKGLMGTIHAASAVDAINRVALLFNLYSGEANLNFDRVIELICRNLEYVVFMENKSVKEVIKILGSDKGVPFFESLISENKKGLFF